MFPVPDVSRAPLTPSPKVTVVTVWSGDRDTTNTRALGDWP